GSAQKTIALPPEGIGVRDATALRPGPPRTEGGFRLYGESDVETLAFIRSVQGLGFTLSEIRGLLDLRGSRLQPCANVRRRLQGKLADVRKKLRDLQKLEHELRSALQSCDKELRRQNAHCPILRDENKSREL